MTLKHKLDKLIENNNNLIKINDEEVIRRIVGIVANHYDVNPEYFNQRLTYQWNNIKQTIIYILYEDFNIRQYSEFKYAVDWNHVTIARAVEAVTFNFKMKNEESINIYNELKKIINDAQGL